MYLCVGQHQINWLSTPKVVVQSKFSFDLLHTPHSDFESKHNNEKAINDLFSCLQH